MAMNPLYAPKAESTGARLDKHPAVKFKKIGDKVVGVITGVGDAWDAPNNFYKEGEPEWSKTVKTQAVNLKTETGDQTLYLNKSRMFQAIGVALADVEMDDLVGLEGWTLGFKLADIDLENKMAKIWEARLVPPSE